MPRPFREPNRQRRPLLAALCCGWVVLWFPATAAAQKDAFVEAFLRLNAALAGTYGDEGPRIGPAVDAMARGLAGWDRSIGELEARVAASTAAGAATAETVRMRLALAQRYAERGRVADAIRELEAVTRQAANAAEAHLLLALLLGASPDTDAAAVAFRAAWALDRSDPVKAYFVLQHHPAGVVSDGQQVLDALARAYGRLAQNAVGQTAATFPHPALFDDRSAVVSTIPHAAYAEAYNLVASGKYESAIAEFRRAAIDDPLVSDPGARTPMMVRAGEAIRSKRPAEARAHLEAALSLAPASSEARRMLGLVSWLNGQDQAGISHLEAAIRANPRDERTRLALARIFARAGRDDEAERTLREALLAIPGSLLAHWWLASDYERLNRIADARHELTLARMPSILTSAAAIDAAAGRLARHAGDSAGAAEALTRRVRARPNDPAAHLDLADVYLDQDRLDEAFRELVAALLVDPSNGRAYAAMGRLELTRGRPDQATVALARALALTPGDFASRYALAMALKQLGRDDEAARELEAYRRAQQQATAERRAQIARDVLNEEAKITGTAPVPAPTGAAR
jgi:tetratricopeptide (TPR) repeat protein